MSATLIFPCGHKYDTSNIRSVTNLRCATCAREAKAKRAKALHTEKPKSSNMAAYEGRVHEPLLGTDPSVASLPQASLALLKAIYREHPYVLHQALKDGRYCVIPGAIG